MNRVRKDRILPLTAERIRELHMMERDDMEEALKEIAQEDILRNYKYDSRALINVRNPRSRDLV